MIFYYSKNLKGNYNFFYQNLEGKLRNLINSKILIENFDKFETKIEDLIKELEFNKNEIKSKLNNDEYNKIKKFADLIILKKNNDMKKIINQCEEKEDFKERLRLFQQILNNNLILKNNLADSFLINIYDREKYLDNESKNKTEWLFDNNWKEYYFKSFYRKECLFMTILLLLFIIYFLVKINKKL